MADDNNNNNIKEILRKLDAGAALKITPCNLDIEGTYFASLQGRSKLLKSGGAGYLKVMERGRNQGKFQFFLPKFKGCTCTAGTLSSYGPALMYGCKLGQVEL